MFDSFYFRELMDVVNTEGKAMKLNPQIHAVIFFIHEGFTCALDNLNLIIYNTSSKLEEDPQCKNDLLLYKYLANESNSVYFDAIIGGHIHALGNRFFKCIPVTHSIDRGLYFNILY